MRHAGWTGFVRWIGFDRWIGFVCWTLALGAITTPLITQTRPNTAPPNMAARDAISSLANQVPRDSQAARKKKEKPPRPRAPRQPTRLPA